MYLRAKGKRNSNKKGVKMNDGSSKNAATICTKKGKLTLRPWLIKQVDEGRIPGLQWHDSSRTLIRIPWVHGSRQIWDLEKHSMLFRAWAEYSGRFDSQNCNPKRWKANFRCALNSLPDVHEVRKLRRKGQNAYKVYKLDMAKCKKKLQMKSTDQSTKSATQTEEVTSSLDVVELNTPGITENPECLNQRADSTSFGIPPKTENTTMLTADLPKEGEAQTLMTMVEGVTSSTDGCAEELNGSPEPVTKEKTYVTLTSPSEQIDMQTKDDQQLLLLVAEIIKHPQKYLHVIHEQFPLNIENCLENTNVSFEQLEIM